MIAGYPRVFNVTATQADGIAVAVGMPTQWLKVRNTSMATAKMYFTADDFTNDVNSVAIPAAAAATPYGEWSGPVRLNQGTVLQPGTVASDRYTVWFKGDSGDATLEVVVLSAHQ